VNQGGGVEGMAGSFGRHARGSKRPQFLINERQQVGGGSAVACRCGIKDARHVGHGGEFNRRYGSGNRKAVRTVDRLPMTSDA
jgi:hypothetical protein